MCWQKRSRNDVFEGVIFKSFNAFIPTQGTDSYTGTLMMILVTNSFIVLNFTVGLPQCMICDWLRSR